MPVLAMSPEPGDDGGGVSGHPARPMPQPNDNSMNPSIKSTNAPPTRGQGPATTTEEEETEADPYIDELRAEFKADALRMQKSADGRPMWAPATGAKTPAALYVKDLRAKIAAEGLQVGDFSAYWRQGWDGLSDEERRRYDERWEAARLAS